jgi:hypothetical protein
LRWIRTATEEMLAHHDSLIRSHIHCCFKYADPDLFPVLAGQHP